MIAGQSKISVRRALLLYLTITFPLAQRIVPTYSAQSGKHAGWLSPVISAVFLIILALTLNRLYQKLDNLSFMEVICEITGKAVGRIICIIYGIWIFIELSKFVRYFAERTVSAVMSGIEVKILIAVILAVVAAELYSGIIVLYRMNEIILPFILLAFFVFALLIAPDINLSYLTPISYLDIIPVLKASMGTTGIWAYLPLVFMLSNGFANKDRFKSESIRTILFLTVITLILNVITIGVFDYSVVERLPTPYLVAIKNISLFSTFQKAEPVAVALWVIEDFILFSVFFYAYLNIMKFLFGLTDVQFLIAPSAVMVYFFSQFIADNRFEIENFSNLIAIPANILLFIILPIILLVTGKIRKRI